MRTLTSASGLLPLAVAASFIVAACAGHDPKSTSPGETAQEGADSLPPDYDGELGPGFRFATRDSLMRKSGPPDSVFSETVPNRHVPGVVDTVFTLFYGDLAATVHKPGNGGDILSAALISHNRYLRTPVIGMTAAEVERAFGSPEWRSDSSFSYGCVGSCMAVEDPVEFIFADNRVQRVRLSYYVD